MTPTGILSHAAIAVVAASAGWWLHARFAPRSHAVMSFTDRAPVVDVKGKTYSFSDLPIELQHRVHGAYLQAHSVFKTTAEDFAARVSVSGGSVPDAFDWKNEVEKSLTEDKIKSSYENLLGFKQMGPLSDAKVRAELVRYLTDSEKLRLISEEIVKLKNENGFKYHWDLPLAPAVDLVSNGFPVIEIGPAGQAAQEEIQVLFSYNRANTEGVFFALSRAADRMKKRIRLRLLIESTGTAKEAAAAALINCIANSPEHKADAWVLHARMIQEVPRLPAEQSTLPIAAFFPGDSGLVKRIQSCAPKPLDEKLLTSHNKDLTALRGLSSALMFLNGRRLSEYDPRGFEGALESTLTATQER